MKPYKHFAPTPHDQKGPGLHDRHDWLVLPCTVARDSEIWEESNWAAQLEILGGESETLEIHRFGHWAGGWFEIALIHPSRQAEGEALEERLENYAFLNEDDVSRREWDAYQQAWESFGAREFWRIITEAIPRLNRFDPSPETLREFFESCIPSGQYYDDGCPRTRAAWDACTRDQLARFIRNLRQPQTQPA